MFGGGLWVLTVSNLRILLPVSIDHLTLKQGKSGLGMNAAFTSFNLPYAYDYMTKLCMQQAKVIQNRENEHVCSIGQGEARHRK
jgi:hypothetical protein